MRDVKVNAWEPRSEEHALRGLAGLSKADEVTRDREERAREMIAACAITPEKAGFEIGSGNGLVARLLAPHCARLDCNDISDGFLREARKTCADCLNVFFHRIEHDYLRELRDGQYDFGYALNVFIHFNIYDIYHYLRDVKRLLKPGGIFHFDACTLGPQTMTVFRQSAMTYRGQPDKVRGLMNFNSPENLRRVIAEIGLTVAASSQLDDDSGWLKVRVTKD